jgi:hypothetical protein
MVSIVASAIVMIAITAMPATAVPPGALRHSQHSLDAARDAASNASDDAANDCAGGTRHSVACAEAFRRATSNTLSFGGQGQE